MRQMPHTVSNSTALQLDLWRTLQFISDLISDLSITFIIFDSVRHAT
jgi:hypothetical protein